MLNPSSVMDDWQPNYYLPATTSINNWLQCTEQDRSSSCITRLRLSVLSDIWNVTDILLLHRYRNYWNCYKLLVMRVWVCIMHVVVMFGNAVTNSRYWYCPILVLLLSGYHAWYNSPRSYSAENTEFHLHAEIIICFLLVLKCGMYVGKPRT